MSNLKDEEELILRKLQNPKGKDKYKYSILSFLFVIVFTIVFYMIPDYYFLEKVTYEVVIRILKLYQYDVQYDGLFVETGPESSFIENIVSFLSSFDAHGGQSPVIKDFDINRRFAIVRACTGMQAGALLMSLILVTPAKTWNKVKATTYVIITLVITNFLRIALIVGMTVTLMVNYGASYNSSWMWAHDVLGKPIGFFGTILFAFIVEGQDVPILNTVSLWIDSLLDLISGSKK